MSFKVFAFSAGRENVHAVLFISVMHSPLSSFCFNYTEKDAKKSPANWNYIAVLWIFGFAVFRESPKKQWAFFGLVTLLYVLQYFVYGSTLPVWLRPFVLLCVPLLLCYNHTLGRRSKVLQWGYYLFYPAHLLVLTLLREIFTRL